MYYIIDWFGSSPAFVMEEGEDVELCFDTLEDANEWAAENMQNGYWQVICGLK
jgi:hypothetical protein